MLPFRVTIKVSDRSMNQIGDLLVVECLAKSRIQAPSAGYLAALRMHPSVMDTMPLPWTQAVLVEDFVDGKWVNTRAKPAPAEEPAPKKRRKKK